MNETVYQHFLDENPYPRFLAPAQTGKIDFSSSDYLNLSQHPLLIERSKNFIETYGTSSRGSRLVTGNLSVYQQIETDLAHFIAKPSALIMGTGYQLNTSVLSALLDESILGAKPLVFCDRYAHASLLLPVLQQGKLLRFQHNDLDHLSHLLNKYANLHTPKMIIVESVYSMEGDRADLSELIRLAKDHQAMLYVDDAHAVGLYGKQGWGLAPEYADEIDFIMGTFSKGLGGFGAYLGCSTVMREYLINRNGGLIYSTGLPPAVLGAISASLELVSQLGAERQHVHQLADRFRRFCREQGCDTGSSDTHIVPWIIGDAGRTMKIAADLLEQGIVGVGIRPPSVPPTKSRIRFCFSKAHTEADLQALQQAMLLVLELQQRSD